MEAVRVPPQITLDLELAHPPARDTEPGAFGAGINPISLSETGSKRLSGN